MRRSYALFALSLLLLGSSFVTQAKERRPEIKRHTQVENRLNNFERWCNDIFVDLPAVIFLPEPLDTGKEGLLMKDDVVGHYGTMSETARQKVDLLLSSFDESRMVFNSHIDAGRDGMKYIGLQEAALNLDSGVAGLVNYSWLREKFGAKKFDLPVFLDEFVQQTSSSLVKALKPDDQNTVRGFTIVFDELPYKSGVMWLQANRASKSINISPLFVRTVFTAATSQGGRPCSIRMKEIKNLYARRKRTAEDIDEILSIVESRFRESMAFPIAHELAHLYLPSDKAANELECDQAAFDNLKQAGMSISLGAFESILIRALQANREDLWGIEDNVQASDVIGRFCVLRRQANLDKDFTDECSVTPKESR